MTAELARDGSNLGPGTIHPVLHDLERKRLRPGEKRLGRCKLRNHFSITERGCATLLKAQGMIATALDGLHESAER